jgi:hypothetical protein
MVSSYQNMVINSLYFISIHYLLFSRIQLLNVLFNVCSDLLYTINLMLYQISFLINSLFYIKTHLYLT